MKRGICFWRSRACGIRDSQRLDRCWDGSPHIGLHHFQFGSFTIGGKQDSGSRRSRFAALSDNRDGTRLLAARSVFHGAAGSCGSSSDVSGGECQHLAADRTALGAFRSAAQGATSRLTNSSRRKAHADRTTPSRKRKFRFAFVLITAQGSQPTQEQLAQVDKYRDEFEKFYRSSASDRASAETGLAKSLRVSLFPAAGVRVGSATRATISTASALTAPLAILLRTRNGVAEGACFGDDSCRGLRPSRSISQVRAAESRRSALRRPIRLTK